VGIVEVAATTDALRRTALLETMRAVSDRTLPIAMANLLVRRSSVMFARHKSKMLFTIQNDHHDQQFWTVVNHPNLVDEVARQRCRAWLQKLEKPFTQSHRDARAALQARFDDDPRSRPRSVAQLIRDFRTKPAILYELVKGLYKKQTGQHLSIDAMWRLFEVAPFWPLYLAGWAHEMFHRAMRESNYGMKGKPGALDLWHAVYLPLSDVFVTNDNGQYRAVRILNVMSKRGAIGGRTRVLRYVSFRDELL
jgi:hypothetical protein